MANATLTMSSLGDFKEALSEAARTDTLNAEEIVRRYVELRPGASKQLRSRRHHLVTGRRGTGKSTLLQVMRHEIETGGGKVAFVDMERFKGRAFPDVLIEILDQLLADLNPPLGWSWIVWRLRRETRRLRLELHGILKDPEAIERSISRHRVSQTTATGQLGGRIARLYLDATLGARNDQGAELTESATFVELKIGRLQQMAVRVASHLSKVVETRTDGRCVVFIDDYYYVQMEEQPFVLDYLHQACKGTGVWLKIGGVGTRLKPYRDSDPPVGMEPDQDLDGLSVDVTLEDFATAKSFLERVLDGVVEPLGLSSRTIMTDDARNRIVLACGGAVPRDYITILSAAADEAYERMSRKPETSVPDVEIKISTADIHRAARKRLTKKEEEIVRDAGRDASALKSRWADILDFAKGDGNTAFILVEQKNLTDSGWGREIAQLENLRMLHRIRDAKPNTANWRGRKCMVYMIDLAAQADERLRGGIVEFWKGAAEFDKLRRAEWVYSPEWRNRGASKVAKASSKSASAKPRPLKDGSSSEVVHSKEGEGEMTLPFDQGNG